LYEKYVQLKKEKGITDYKVAKETGITRSTFTDWKNGVSIPKAPKIHKIAIFFNVPIGYFYDEGVKQL
jgi:transcriptional regulator with XRE-family HTH domain